MSAERFMRIHSPEFKEMCERVLRVTQLTSRLNLLPFEDEGGKAELFELILGRPLPQRATIYPPFFTDNGLGMHLAERVFINQNCTFLDYAGIYLGARAMIMPGVHIGRDAVVAAGAVVVDDVPAASFVTGPKAGVRRNW